MSSNQYMPGYQPDGSLRDESEATRRTVTQSLSAPRTVGDVSMLSTLSPYDGQVVTFLNYSSSSEGGSNSVRYVAGGGTAADSALVFDDGANPGRWHVLNKSTINVDQCGAVGNGVADDTAAVQRALDSGASVTLSAQKTYDCSGLVVKTSYAKITGPSSATLQLSASGDDSENPAVLLKLGNFVTDGVSSGVDLDEPASYLTLRGFSMVTSGAPSHTVGLYVSNCVRTSLVNLRIGEGGGGFSRGYTAAATTAVEVARNHIINIVDCQIQANTVNLHRVGHSTRIRGGEVQGGRHGLIQNPVDSSYNPVITDASQLSTSNYGASITISGTTFEGFSYSSGVSYGIFVQSTQQMPTIDNVYFEDIGAIADGEAYRENGVAIQVGWANSTSKSTRVGTISNCYFGDVATCIAIGRATGLTITGCDARAGYASYKFLDGSAHSTLPSRLHHRDNVVASPIVEVYDPNLKLVNTSVIPGETIVDATYFGLEQSGSAADNAAALQAAVDSGAKAVSVPGWDFACNRVTLNSCGVIGQRGKSTIWMSSSAQAQFDCQTGDCDVSGMQLIGAVAATNYIGVQVRKGARSHVDKCIFDRGGQAMVVDGADAETAAADNTTNTFTASAHGFSDGMLVVFSTSGALPAEIVAGEEYYVVNKTTNTFQVSQTLGGDVLAFTDDGSGTHTATVKPGYLRVTNTVAKNQLYYAILSNTGVVDADNCDFSGNVNTGSGLSGVRLLGSNSTIRNSRFARAGGNEAAYIYSDNTTNRSIGNTFDGEIPSYNGTIGSADEHMVEDLGSAASGTETFAFTNGSGNTKTLEVTGDVSIEFTADLPGTYYAIIEQDDSGGHTVTTSTSVTGSAPSISTSIGVRTLIPLLYDGSTWFYL